MTNPGRANRMRQQAPAINEGDLHGSAEPFTLGTEYDESLSDPSVGSSVSSRKVFSFERLVNRELGLYREENHEIGEFEFDTTLDLLGDWSYKPQQIKGGAVIHSFARPQTPHDPRLNLRGVLLDPKLVPGEKTSITAKFASGREKEGDLDELRVYTLERSIESMLSIIALEKRIRRIQEASEHPSILDELTDDERAICADLWLPLGAIAVKHEIEEPMVTRHLRQAAHRMNLQSPEDVAIAAAQGGIIAADIPTGRTKGINTPSREMLQKFPGTSIETIASDTSYSKVRVETIWSELAEHLHIDHVPATRMQMAIMAAADGTTSPHFIPELEANA